MHRYLTFTFIYENNYQISTSMQTSYISLQGLNTRLPISA